MKKAADYRSHADECRQLAARALTIRERDQLLAMAATWESLASDRENMVAKCPEVMQGEEITSRTLLN